jgi:hypothetical protein
MMQPSHLAWFAALYRRLADVRFPPIADISGSGILVSDELEGALPTTAS